MSCGSRKLRIRAANRRLFSFPVVEAATALMPPAAVSQTLRPSRPPGIFHAFYFISRAARAPPRLFKHLESSIMPVSIIKPNDNGASGCSSSPSLIFTAARFDLFTAPPSENGARFHPAMTKPLRHLKRHLPTVSPSHSERAR